MPPALIELEQPELVPREGNDFGISGAVEAR